MLGVMELFEGLTPATTTTAAEWWSGAQDPRGVTFPVPPRFEAVVRVHHRLRDGRSWADTLPEALVTGAGDPPPADEVSPYVEQPGALDPETVDQLVPLLQAATSTPALCHFGLWVGWGGLSVGSSFALVAVDGEPDDRAWVPLRRWRSRQRMRVATRQRLLAAEGSRAHAFIRGCAVLPAPWGRDMLLMDGPVAAVAAVGLPGPDADGSFQRWAPQRWWPQDRAWFVGTDIDDAWTYVAGSDELANAIERLPVEAVRVPNAID